jgi:hypothetical protein
MNWLETLDRTAHYLALRETPHDQMIIALPKRRHLSKLPSPPTRRTMKFAKVATTLQMSINQFALAIWYPYKFSNNLNVWKLCSTIGRKSEEAEASNLWNYAWQNEQITRRIEDAHLCFRGEQMATWSSASCQVCLRSRCSSQAWSTNFDALETIQGGEARRRLLHKIYEKAKCMYGYPLSTFNSALSNFHRFTFHSHCCVQGRLHINGAHSPTKEACQNVMQFVVQ